MPGSLSMFSRRRGSSASRASSQNVPLDRTTTSNAAAAASQAFMGRPPSSGSLSSAAAAAALRSMTTTPEPVGNLQTKRMVRRGSVSSTGSGSIVTNGRGGVPGRGALQRRDSGGSMTERTFRSPSPGRSNSITSSASNAPPVPAVPKSVPKQHQRSSSLDPPQRVISPTPSGRGAGRAASMDRNSMPPPASSRAGKRLSNVHEEQLERSDSNRNSNVNFSRPMNSQPSSPVSPTSPTDKSYTHGPGNWFSEPVPVPSGSTKTSKEIALEQKVARIQAAAGQPVKKDNSASSAQGSHLNRSNSQASHTGPSPASYQAADAVMVYDPSTRTFVAKPRAQPVQRVASPEPPPSPTTWRSAAPKPGTYDPHTRTIVPLPEPKATARQEPLGLDTDLQPPPRNPARLSPTLSATRGGLHKQPSVVREEPEDEGSSVAGSDVVATQKTSGPAKSYVAPPGSKKERSSSLDIPRGALDSASRGRGGSTSRSPSRIHFSASPVIEATKHDPPPRDVSPSKPALKHSHSPVSSIRTNSPLANFSPAPKSPISETSDNTSQASQDAFTGRKKKSVRVSFDEHAQEIEPPTVAATPKSVMRPMIDDVDDEELMKPRPALPSFGSVRKQRVTHDVPEKVTEMAPERQDVSNDHAIGGILKNAEDAKTPGAPVAPVVTSKETAEAAGYESDDSDDLGEPTATSTPAQPTTAAEDKLDSKPEKTQETKVRDFAETAPEGDKNEDGDVPAITLLPPTPGVEEERKTLSDDEKSPSNRHSSEINVPGGWDGDDENEAEATSARAATATAAAIESQDKHIEVPEEPVIYESPQPASPALDAINEDNSDDSAEFSDAAEDLSELDNGGFASLDAIAVSPVISSSSPGKSKENAPTLPESPTAQRATKKMEKATENEGKGSGDWSEATAYWSKLSQQQREQIEREHLSSDDEARPAPVRKAKKKTTAQAVPAAASTKSQPQAAAQPAKPALKKTMRAQPEPTPAPAAEREVHMRKSMRNGGAGLTAGTLRNSTSSARSQQQGTAQPATQPKGILQKGHTRQESSGQLSMSGLPGSGPQDSAFPKVQATSLPKPQPQPKPKAQPAPVISAKLQKELTNDSDSESSFKKKRRSKADTGGKITMKRSMRGGPVAAEPAPPMRAQRPTSPEPARGKGKDSFSIRSLSPTGSLFGRRKRGEEVRQSIRGSSVDAGPRMTMRNGPPSRAGGRPASTQASTGSRFKSRFADSDDEDEGERPRRGFFKSRFTDSDDEDDDVFIPADLTPVRGIPRRQGQNDGDSTDLEDEDEDETPSKTSRRRQKMNTPMVPDPNDVDKAMEAARKKLGIAEPTAQDNSQGSALRTGSLRQESVEPSEPTPEKKKRGFMGSILRRNRNSTASVPQVRSSVSEINVSSNPEAPAEPSSETARPQSPIASPNGKLMRRSSGQQVPKTRMRRGDSNYSNATAPPAVGESFSAADRDNWPLPPAVPKIPAHLAGGDDRPITSDGANNSVVRFDVGADEGMEPQRGAVYSRRTGKKKKFGMLRRAFGLND